MTGETRQRMVFSAMQLFREFGYSGTGFRDVIAHSGAPRGSIYHHFPGGKAELGANALEMAADFVDAALEEALLGASPADGVAAFLAWWTDFLEEGGFAAGCPVLAVAAENHPEAPQLSAAAAAAFRRWESTLARALSRSHVEPETSQDLATLVVAAIEGAMVMCRATGDRRPLECVGRQLTALLGAAVQAGPG